MVESTPGVRRPLVTAAWSVLALGAAALFVAGLVAEAGRSGRIGLIALTGATWWVAGVVVAFRGRAAPGPLLTASFLVTFGTAGIHGTDQLLALDPVWGPVVAVLQFVGSALLAVFLFTFPDGRCVPHWTWVVVLTWTLIEIDAYLVDWLPLPPGGGTVGAFLAAALLVGGFLAQRTRYRRADDETRRQTRVVLLGTGAATLGIAALIVPALVEPRLWLPDSPYRPLLDVGVTGLFLLVPASIALATWRHRLWDLEPVVAGFTVYAALSLVVVTAYTAVVAGLAQVLGADGAAPAAAAVVAVGATAGTRAAPAAGHPARLRPPGRAVCRPGRAGPQVGGTSGRLAGGGRDRVLRAAGAGGPDRPRAGTGHPDRRVHRYRTGNAGPVASRPTRRASRGAVGAPAIPRSAARPTGPAPARGSLAPCRRRRDRRHVDRGPDAVPATTGADAGGGAATPATRPARRSGLAARRAGDADRCARPAGPARPGHRRVGPGRARRGTAGRRGHDPRARARPAPTEPRRARTRRRPGRAGRPDGPARHRRRPRSAPVAPRGRRVSGVLDHFRGAGERGSAFRGHRRPRPSERARRARRHRPGRRRGHRRTAHPRGRAREHAGTGHQFRNWFGRLGADPPQHPFPTLTDREDEILHLVARGLGNATIATELSLSVKTVANYASSVFTKLQVASRAEAIVRARERGYGHDPP